MLHLKHFQPSRQVSHKPMIFIIKIKMQTPIKDTSSINFKLKTLKLMILASSKSTYQHKIQDIDVQYLYPYQIKNSVTRTSRTYSLFKTPNLKQSKSALISTPIKIISCCFFQPILAELNLFKHYSPPATGHKQVTFYV